MRSGLSVYFLINLETKFLMYGPTTTPTTTPTQKGTCSKIPRISMFQNGFWLKNTTTRAFDNCWYRRINITKEPELTGSGSNY